jgi:2-oxoglutarate dehydrogenase complex dehydrogenase (E1) component-like enzyme
MAESEFEDLGPNSGLAEEMHARYLEDPATVPDDWREFFAARGV